ncbi:hypothetical protein CSKR_200232 [Clonorchis sinensis]|uniref:Uncharacterized protein n=1 Tax=Clonorchis sinensis TaxID=79923 RepID=A0A8T1LZ23_CLOSI|nr:hypothetical protein CSKR_200232 [Clonorchis sinensis]
MMMQFVGAIAIALLGNVLSQNPSSYRVCMDQCGPENRYMCLIGCSAEEEIRCEKSHRSSNAAKHKCIVNAYAECVAFPSNYVDFRVL